MNDALFEIGVEMKETPLTPRRIVAAIATAQTRLERATSHISETAHALRQDVKSNPARQRRKALLRPMAPPVGPLGLPATVLSFLESVAHRPAFLRPKPHVSEPVKA